MEYLVGERGPVGKFIGWLEKRREKKQENAARQAAYNAEVEAAVAAYQREQAARTEQVYREEQTRRNQAYARNLARRPSPSAPPPNNNDDPRQKPVTLRPSWGNYTLNNPIEVKELNGGRRKRKTYRRRRNSKHAKTSRHK
jgi:hypothetical protein